MIRFRRFVLLAAALAVAAVFGTATPARAAFAVQVYDDGVLFAVTQSVTTIGPLVTLSYSGATTDFAVSGTATYILGATGRIQVSYNSAVTVTSGGTHTLTLLVSNQGYVLPPSSPLILSSSGGGSYIGTSPGTLQGSTLGFLDASNTLFGNGVGGTVAVGSPSGAVLPNAQSTPVSNTATLTGNSLSQALVYTPPTGVKLVSSAVPFSLTNVSFFTFTNASLGDGANISNSLTTASVPVPAGLVLALSGIPCLGMGAWLRRRRQAV